MILFDLDDWYPKKECLGLDWLIDAKHKYPDLKVTLFTILGRWNGYPLKSLMEAFPWVEYGAHGFMHDKNSECMEWDKKRWFEVLNLYEQMGFTKIFKAPNWEMSRLGFQVLKEMDWAVACRGFQIDEVPRGAKYYSFEEQNGVHGHTWLLEADELKGKFNDWKKTSEFGFISDYLRIK